MNGLNVLNKTLVISGKKQSGKSTLANYLSGYIITKFREDYHRDFNSFSLDEKGLLTVYDHNPLFKEPVPFKFETDEHFHYEFHETINLFSFADPLKEMCVNLFGIDRHKIYGTDAQKNEFTQYHWSDLPYIISQLDFVQGKYIDLGRDGFVTGREFMEYLGTNFIREINPNAWRDGTLAKCKESKSPYNFVRDGRFPNEMQICNKDDGIYSVRLGRVLFPNNTARPEIALDDFPCSKYDVYVDNTEMSQEETGKYVTEKLYEIGFFN